MSTQRDQLANDSLGCTIRETLQMYVHDQLPSERVWQRIRSGLEKGANRNNSETSHGQRPFWIAPLLQVAAVLMLCLVHGIGLHTPAAMEPTVVSHPAMPAVDAAPSSTNEKTSFVPTHRRTVDVDLRLLKQHSTPAAPAVPTVDVHEPLLTANLGALQMEDAGTRRAIAGEISTWTVLESRIRQ